jgi:uncharacterized protein (TIRG00374 family)
MRSRARLVMFMALFVALAGTGIAWGIHAGRVTTRDLAALARLPAATLVALGVLAIGLYAVDLARYRVFGWAIGDAVSWRAALDASVANFFFGWITPGAALGAPAAIVMLGRRGVSWEGAALIAFGKSMTGTAVLVGLAFVAAALGLGPGLDGGVRAVFASGLGVLAAVMLVPIAGAVWPAWTIRQVDRLEGSLARRRGLAGPRARRFTARACEALRTTVRRLAHLRAGGPAVPLAILAVHLAYLAVFVAVAVVLARAFGAASLRRAIGTSTLYAAFTYVAPTPGGAGLSEAVATRFYGAILAPRSAVLVVLLFRSLTFYLQIAVGAVYLGVVGGTREILEKQPGPPA